MAETELEGFGRPAIPRVGAQVHYVAHGTPVREDGSQAFPMACRAAIITEINGRGNVGLFVINPTGVFLHPADYDAGSVRSFDPATDSLPLPALLCTGMEHQGGTWHWPAA